MKKKLWWVSAGLVWWTGLAAVVLLGLGGWQVGGASAEQLVIYSGRGEKFTIPVAKAFTARTGIKARTLVGEAGQMLARIREEGSRTKADILMSNYAGVLEGARREGLLQGYASPMLTDIPRRYVGPGNQWFGASARGRVIVYNKNQVQSSELDSILDMARPKWKGKLGITVSTNGSFVGGLATMLAQHGEPAVVEFLRGIKENAGNNVFPKHTPIVSAVARGELAVGLVNHYYFYRAIAKNPNLPIGIFYPDPKGVGAPSTISGLAILKHAKSLNAARKFVDFVLSPEGQKIFAEINYEFPVNAKVALHPLLPKAGTVKLAPVNQALKVEKVDRAIALIKEIGLQ